MISNKNFINDSVLLKIYYDLIYSNFNSRKKASL